MCNNNSVKALKELSDIPETLRVATQVVTPTGLEALHV